MSGRNSEVDTMKEVIAMSSEIRLQRNRFQPGCGIAAEICMLEQRVVLNSSFKFPAGLVGLLPGQKGNLIMTSRAYEKSQRQVDKAFHDFAGSMARLQKQYGPDYLANPNVIAKIGLGGAGVYGSDTILGKLDAAMQAAEARFPYGRGVTTDPVVGTQLGLGLSVASAAVSPNDTLAFIAADPNLDGASGHSVAEFLDAGLANIAGGTSTTNVSGLISTLRAETLQFRAIQGGEGLLGTLPQYLAQFGPTGAGSFSLKNT